MFPSPNRDDPFEFLFQKQSFLCDESPSSKQDTNPSPYFNFASPFFHEHELPLSQIFSQKRRMPIEDTILIEKEAEEPIPNAQFKRRNIGAVPRKRNGKKDRHSKICTAHGVRDRRMRLSLQVARKFFDLQDMLGYDKASKTIDWLFSKSSTAIKELIKDHPQAKYVLTSDAKSESFLSECEVVSEENSNNEVVREGNAPTDVMPFCTNPCEKDDIKSVAHACNKPNTRETRIQARSRARYRTRERMMIDRPEIISSKSNPNSKDELQKLGLSSNVPFKGVDQESGPIIKEKISTCESDHYPSSVVQQTCDVGTIEKLLLGSSNSSSTSAASGCVDTNSNFVRYLGNWDLFDNYSLNLSHHDDQDSLAGNPNSIYSTTSIFHQ